MKWVNVIREAIGCRNFFEFYKLGDIIGKGQFGVIKIGTNLNTNKKVAVKIITKAENKNVDDNENTNFYRNKKRSRSQNGNENGKQNNGTEEDQHEFDINIDTADPGPSSEEQIPECLGLGIVRGIDVERQLLYLITPIAVTVLNKFKGKRDRMSILLILISIII